MESHDDNGLPQLHHHPNGLLSSPHDPNEQSTASDADAASDPPLLQTSVTSSTHTTATVSQGNVSGANSVTTHITPAGGILSAADDEELQRHYATHEEQITNRERKQNEIEFLEVTKRELEGWTSGEGNLDKDEYFDLQYFAKSAENCWGERKADDAGAPPVSAQAEKTTKVRLFPTESAILQQKEVREKLQRDRTLQNEHDLSLKHPLMYRRMKRNKERREVFANALEEHRNASAQDSLPLHSISPVTGSYSTQRDFAVTSQSPSRPFANVMGYNASRQAQLQIENEKKAAAAAAEPLAITDEAAGGGENGEDEEKEKEAPKPKTLKDLIREQETMMVDVAKHDEEVYKPILKACYEYEEQAQRRLTELSGLLDTPPQQTIAN